MAVLLSALTAFSVAGEPGNAPPSTEEVQALIAQLESADFKARQVASRRLAEAGPAAIEPLTRAAQSVERETMVRALDILAQFSKSEDESLKAAARAGLEQVAESSNPRAAARAKAILDPPKPKEPPMPRVGGGLIIGPNGIQGGRIVIGGGNKGIQIGGGGVQLGKVGQIITTKVNGANRTVQVVHGDGQEILIEDTADRVKISVVEIGKAAKPRSAEAKNADELKEKNAELYEIYKQYDGYRKSGVTIKGG
jgi:hypothetical protein